jgi:hypothetical protein
VKQKAKEAFYMKKWFVVSFVSILVLGFLFVGISVSAASEDSIDIDSSILEVDEITGDYTLESMLTYAILDEYLAKATYEEILAVYGDIRPFNRIVLAEQTHIDLLLPLFETYGIAIPENNASESVLVPDSIASALATGVEAEKANILLYESFLAQTDLPDDVRAVFESLKAASEKHLNAFSRDRLVGAGYDMAYQFRKMFGQGQQTPRGQFNQGLHDCPNA